MKTTKQMMLVLKLLVALFLLGAPVAAPQEEEAVERTPLPPEAYVPPRADPSAGSLWGGAGLTVDWVSDLRARHVGDLLTIQIVENVRASQQADTESERDTNVSGGIDQLFGLQNYLPDNLELAQLIGAASSTRFAGGGANTRTNTLTATITATVVEALPNGNLVVEATRFVRVNEEEERLTLRGMVRRYDISPRNVVPSTAVADVEILYGGKGVIGSNLKPGILFRLVRYIF